VGRDLLQLLLRLLLDEMALSYYLGQEEGVGRGEELEEEDGKEDAHGHQC
jgi:hypothetical protein